MPSSRYPDTLAGFGTGEPGPARGPRPPLPSRGLWEQIRALIWSQPRTRRWPVEKVEDAASETLTLLYAQPPVPDWDRIFLDRDLSHPDSPTVRAAIFHAINVVFDRFRDRRKQEVKPGSVYFDEEKARANPDSRQRRVLEPNRSLGAADQQVAVDPENGPELRDRMLDIKAAMRRLRPRARKIVRLKIHHKEPWARIAGRFRVRVPEIQEEYRAAMALLTRWLKPYDHRSDD